LKKTLRLYDWAEALHATAWAFESKAAKNEVEDRVQENNNWLMDL
jgi:hypothetical protein